MNSPDHGIPKDLAPIKKRIGFFGGTFDPIHYGHIKPAISVKNYLQLDQLFLLPAHIPPHKTQTFSSAPHRLAMAKLVNQHESSFQIDIRELHRSTPSYTVDSLAEIAAEYKNAQLFFIVGMDSLLNFTQWHQWQNILTLCHLVVNVRANYSINDLSITCHQQLAKHFSENLNDLATVNHGRIFINRGGAFDISSTDIRGEITEGILDYDKMPDYIIDYIKQHQLYQQI